MSRQSTSGNSVPNRTEVESSSLPTANRQLPTLILLLLALLFIGSACRKNAENGAGGAKGLRAVPAERLAYTLTPDTDAPPGAQPVEETKLKPIQDDFDTRRKDDRLLRTVVSPDGQRALALYDTGETQESEFRIDMYAADGRFLRNLTPSELSGAFAAAAHWSPDGQSIAFIGRKSLAQPTPPDMIPEGAPVTAPSVAPAFAPVPVYDTEQVYICDRDGFQLRPLTTRGGLIYFYLAWSPDSHALVALACREDEWDVREREHKLPAGRPRLIETDGRERLLDDGLTEAGPVWSPDSSKVATGFETDVKIYDALASAPTLALIPLREPLLTASTAYDEKNLKSKSKQGESTNGKGKEASAPQTSGMPVSFNPIVRLEWPDDKTLFIQTAYVRIYASEPVNTFQRWHKVNLSVQATGASRAEASAPPMLRLSRSCYSSSAPKIF
jgi:dipeptidyl aminopeptidase/acylaminoacyl peptidase